MQTKIQRIDENNKVVNIYENIMAAARDIESKKDAWQVAITIAYAMNHNKRAYKSKWKALSK